MMLVTTDSVQDLLIVRWDAPGTDTSYLLDDRDFLRRGQSVTQRRWLLDFRLHGDLSPANAHYFFHVVAPDEARRLAHPLRVAVVVGPSFAVIPATIPSAAQQHAWGLAVAVFTGEGPAQQWVLGAESPPAAAGK